MLSAKLICEVLIVVVVPVTVKLPLISTSLENEPVVADIGFEPEPNPPVTALSTYALFAASVPDTGVPTSLIKFEFKSKWSPTCKSPDEVFSSPVN